MQEYYVLWMTNIIITIHNFFVSDQIRDYKMKIKNMVNKETIIECKNTYNYSIIYQIINRYKN
jgi:hypothetical protein